jgi:hypothetical protein
VRCGELCGSCVGRCRGVVNSEQRAEIECVMCGGIGCGECENGYMVLSECPSSYIGQELIGDINIVAACSDGVLPVSGGLMDQSAYWFELSQAMKREINAVEKEQHERRSRHA